MLLRWIIVLGTGVALMAACGSSSSSLPCSADKAVTSCSGTSPQCFVQIVCPDTGSSYTLDCGQSSCTCSSTKVDGGKGPSKKVPFQAAFCSADPCSSGSPVFEAANHACFWGFN